MLEILAAAAAFATLNCAMDAIDGWDYHTPTTNLRRTAAINLDALVVCNQDAWRIRDEAETSVFGTHLVLTDYINR